ncbi:MAG: helix-turn-helix domain-containing protein [Actinomycetota bacterium]
MVRRAGGELIREARRAAGLTQTELARSMNTGQSVIARWERGLRSPTHETILTALAVCGFELQTTIKPREEPRPNRAAVARMLRLSPTERLELITVEGRNLLKLGAAAG